MSNARKDKQDSSEVLSIPRSRSNKHAGICQSPSWAQRPSCALLCPGTSTSTAGHRSCCLEGKWELPFASCLHGEHRRHLTWEEVWISYEFGLRISTFFPCSLSSYFTAPLLPCRTPAPAGSGSSRTCSEH